jgi:hypothetical protein
MSISITEIRAVLQSEGFQEELAELSSYAANIKQERPIVCLLSKYLSRQGLVVALEKKVDDRKADLVVDGTSVEVKLNYESDLVNELKKGLDRTNWNLHELTTALQRTRERKKSTTWNMAWSIVKDICEKKPDIFLLVICSRNLLELGENDSDKLNNICVADRELAYNKSKSNGYNNRGNLELARKFLELFREARGFKSHYMCLYTEWDFPSTYHFYMCDFQA